MSAEANADLAPAPGGPWTPVELWVWDQLRRGEPADLNRRDGTALDPFDQSVWSDGRVLSGDFITAIGAEPFASAIAAPGVVIRGAWIQGHARVRVVHGSLDLASCRLEASILLEDCDLAGSLRVTNVWARQRIWCIGGRIHGGLTLTSVEALEDVSFDRVQIDGSVSITSNQTVDRLENRPGRSRLTRFHGRFALDDVSVKGGVHVSGIEARTLTFRHAAIVRAFFLADLTVRESVDLRAVDAAGGLRLHDVRADQVMVRESTIGGDCSVFNLDAGAFEMERVSVKGRLSVRAALRGSVTSGGKPLAMRCLAFDRVSVSLDVALTGTLGGTTGADLTGLSSGSGTLLSGLVCEGPFSLDEARIGGDLTVRKSSIGGHLTASLATIGGSVELSDDDLGSVSLAGAAVTRDLSLGTVSTRPPRWRAGSRLELRNAQIGALSDRASAGSGDPWPPQLDLRGCTFNKLVAFGGLGEDRADLRSASLLAWLRRDVSNSLQPYVHLAKTLRDAGEWDKANDILYAGRELARRRKWRERDRAGWLGLSVLKVTIGYGIGARYFRVVPWVLLLVAIGVGTLAFDQRMGHHLLTSPGTESTSVTWMAAASLDALLPIVSLDKSFDVIPKELVFFWAKVVFWVLGLAGWALGSFLVAGLAGITQKPS